MSTLYNYDIIKECEFLFFQHTMESSDVLELASFLTLIKTKRKNFGKMQKSLIALLNDEKKKKKKEERQVNRVTEREKSMLSILNIWIDLDEIMRRMVLEMKRRIDELKRLSELGLEKLKELVEEENNDLTMISKMEEIKSLAESMEIERTKLKKLEKCIELVELEQKKLVEKIPEILVSERC